MIFFDKSDIKANFNSTIYSRGLAYWRSGKVEQLEYQVQAGDLIIQGEVEGSNQNNYIVDITIRELKNGSITMQSQCTCPYEIKCKHAVASLLEFLAMEQVSQPKAKTQHPAPAHNSHTRPNTAAKPANTSNQPVLSQPSALSNDITNWLGNLTKTAHYQQQAELQLVYILDLTHYQKQTVLSISLIVAKKDNAGKYKKPQPFNKAQHQAQLNDNEDLEFIAKIETAQLLTEKHKATYYVHGTKAAYLIEALVKTGRCHWQAINSTPLSKGPVRTADPFWQELEDTTQQFAFKLDIEAAIILPTEPLFYINLAQSECGRLQLSIAISDALSLVLLDTPPIPTSQVALVNEKFDQTPELNPLPRLKALEIVELEPTKPIFHLYFFNKNFTNDFEKNIKIPIVRFTVLYHDCELPYNQPFETYHTYYDAEAATLKRFKRIKSRETKAIKLLKDNLFRPLKEVKIINLTPEAINEAELIVTSTQYIFNYEKEEVNLISFIYDVVSQLKENPYWKIEFSDDFLYQILDPALADDWYGDIAESSGIDWFGLELGVYIDNEKVNLLPLLIDLIKVQSSIDSLQEMLALPDDSVMTLRLDEQRLLPVTLGRIKPILQVLIELLHGAELDEDERLRMQRLHAAHLVELEAALQAASLRWLGGEELVKLGHQLKDFKSIASVQVPETFNAELRPYQQTGINWLQFLREYQLSGILADDMGLGKTVQTLAHILIEKKSGRLTQPALVIAPTSLMGNWRLEANRFAPELKVLTLHGTERHDLFEQVPEYDLILTTYPLLPRDKKSLLQYHYHLLILDEAQNIKNPKAKATQIVHQLKARHRLCLTGTPMENHLGELWSMFHFLLPGLLGDYTYFRYIFRNPIEKDHDSQRQQLLHKRIKPFMLRRTKQAVITELPEKTEIVHYVELSNAQRDLYETIRLMMNEKVRKEISNRGISRSQIIILDALLKLRQVCCDPRLLKMEAAKNITQSAKLNTLMEMLRELIDEGRRILIFSQFTSMLNLIEPALHADNIAYVKLTGQTRKRAEAIETFQNGQVPVFLISLKAGGTGLNLTAADTVIHYDPWWNPAVEQQATDRAHRIGQINKVFVYKLITVGTVEEKIQELQQRKQQLADALLNGTDQAGSQLSQQDLEVLFAPLA